ncbi:AKT-interacting protein-like [Bacillus rossius redtenbacheri]|uniref:AKT-interacting protein-like n=1 Tax=Bacillus rossius redtenbacheri TaxID=93214 RepID=UPI002FDE07EA
MASHSSGKVETDDSHDSFRRQGSFRKVLSSLPSADSQLSMSAKMIDRPAVSARVVQKTYGQYQQEYSLLSEYNLLRKQELPGIYVISSAHSSLLWFGVLFVRQGLFQGAVFRFNIHISETFPDGNCPHVVFQSKVFHPLVSPDTGEMDLKSGFPEWRKNGNHLWQVVQYVRRAFYKIETKSAINKEAVALYEEDKELFREKVRDCVKESQERVYDPPAIDDPHYISFDPYVEELHGPIREAMFRPKESDEPASLGLSWVQHGSLQPFSKLSS